MVTAKDKLRLLRAVRFTATYGFVLEPATRAAVEAMAPEVTAVSGERIGAELRRIWNASSLQTAQEQLGHLVAAYRGTADRLADWLEHNVPEGLAVFTLPEPHWRRMRTANPIERAIQQEIKRRTSKVRVFPNRDALLRLATAVLVEIDEEWATSDRIYITWHNSDT